MILDRQIVTVKCGVLCCDLRIIILAGCRQGSSSRVCHSMTVGNDRHWQHCGPAEEGLALSTALQSARFQMRGRHKHDN